LNESASTLVRPRALSAYPRHCCSLATPCSAACSQLAPAGSIVKGTSEAVADVVLLVWEVSVSEIVRVVEPTQTLR